MKKSFLILCAAAAFCSAAYGAAPKSTAPAAPAVPAVPVPPGLKLALPEVIYAAPGIESNIYFENILDSANAKAYAFEVKCAKGAQGNTRWFWTPDKKDAGKSFDLELRLFNDYGRVLTGKCKIVVAGEPADYKRKITLALLADSGVNCAYPAHLLKVMRENGFVNYTPVGKHAGGGKPVVKGGVAHDGYGGFSWNSFLERWAYTPDELPKAQNEAEKQQMRALGVKDAPKSQRYRLCSPLLKVVNGKKVVDIPGWFKAINEGKAPDFIVIQLGGNDIFSARTDTLDSRCAEVMKKARTLLTCLRKHAPDTVIGVTTCPYCCSQDGFGANYRCYQSQYQYRRNASAYNRAIAALIKEMKDPKLKLIPLHQAIDSDSSYITRKVPFHARSKKTVVRDINALHLTTEGGYQLGDAIYCWLRKELEK